MELLGRVLDEVYARPKFQMNHPYENIPMTDKELEDLHFLLDEYINSREFRLKAYFVESLFDRNLDSDARARSIYFAERAIRGRRSRTMSGRIWQNFKARLGLGLTFPATRPVRRMTYEHFQKMEGRLLSTMRLSARTIQKLLDQVSSAKLLVDSVRQRSRDLKDFSIKGALFEPILNLVRAHMLSPIRELPAAQISAVLLIVSNLGVIFTTRDWDAAGVISAIAAALPYAAGRV